MSEDFSEYRQCDENSQKQAHGIGATAFGVGLAGIASSLLAVKKDFPSIFQNPEIEDNKRMARDCLKHMKQTMTEQELADFLSRWIGRYMARSICGDVDEMDIAKYYEYADELAALYRKGVLK